MNNPNKQARERVSKSATLQQYEDILFYDWNEGEDHLEWVATADESEIVEWASEIRENEQQ